MYLEKDIYDREKSTSDLYHSCNHAIDFTLRPSPYSPKSVISECDNAEQVQHASKADIC